MPPSASASMFPRVLGILLILGGLVGFGGALCRLAAAEGKLARVSPVDANRPDLLSPSRPDQPNAPTSYREMNGRELAELENSRALAVFVVPVAVVSVPVGAACLVFSFLTRGPRSERGRAGRGPGATSQPPSPARARGHSGMRSPGW
jgi:hypothetical protein